MAKNFLNNEDLLCSNSITIKNKFNDGVIQKNENDIIIKTEGKQLNEIFKLMLNESEFLKNDSEKLLIFYITENQKKLTEILDKVYKFLSENAINYKIIIKIINSIYNTLAENVEIINFISTIIPILIDNLFHKNIINDLDSIKAITNFIAELLKEGGIYTKELIGKYMDLIFHELYYNREMSLIINYKNLYLFSALLNILDYLEFYKIMNRNKNLIYPSQYNLYIYHKDKEVRLIFCHILYQEIKLSSNLNKVEKLEYFQFEYSEFNEIFESVLKKNNNILIDYSFLNGFFILTKNFYLANPFYFHNLKRYLKLVDTLKSCLISDKSSNDVIIEYLKFIPELYKINKNIFIEKYCKYFLELMNNLLMSSTNVKIKNQILLNLGYLNSYIKEELFNVSLIPLITTIKNLINEKNISDELLICLTNIMSNKNNKCSNKIIDSININSFLSFIYKTPLSSNKNDFILTLIDYYKNPDEKNNTIIIALNAISFIINNEYFSLEFYNKTNTEKKFNHKIDSMLSLIQKNIFLYNNQNNFNEISINKTNNILNALKLFSKIDNNLFYKDMMSYYCNKLLPLTSSSNNKINKKIINIILCNFVKIYDNDYEFSEISMKKIIRNIINIVTYDENDDDYKVFALKIFIEKEELHLFFTNKDNFFLKSLSQIVASHENTFIKENIIQVFSVLLLKKIDTDNLIQLSKYLINNICLNLVNSKNMSLIEDSTNMLLYLVFNLKSLCYQNYYYSLIISTLIYLLLSNEFKGMIRINIFLILNELLNTDLIKEKFENNFLETFTNLLFVISLFYFIKFNSESKYLSETIFKILYKLIKINNINIFENYNICEYIKTNINTDIINENLLANKLFDKIEYDKKLLFIAKQLNNIKLVDLFLNYYGHAKKNFNELLTLVDICGLFNVNSIKYKLNNDKNLITILFEEIKAKILDNKFHITTCNSNYKSIDLSSTEPTHVKVVLFLMKLLKNKEYKVISLKIISYLEKLIIILINQNENNLINIILPTLLEIIPNFENITQKQILENIILIIKRFPKESKSNINKIVKLVINYPINENLAILFKLFTILFENYGNELEFYYSTIIHKLLFDIKKEKKHRTLLIRMLSLLCSNDNIFQYLNGIIINLKDIYLFENENKNLFYLFEVFKKIANIKHSSIFYKILIPILLEKIKKITTLQKYLKIQKINKDFINLIINQTLDIFHLMKNNYIIFLSPFLSSIIKIFSNITEIKKNSFLHKKLIQLCNNRSYKTNVNLIAYKNIKYLNLSIFTTKEKMLYDNGNKNLVLNANSKRKKDQIISEKYSSVIPKNKELILEAFDNSQCKNKEDWELWLNSTSRILLECSP